MLQYDQIYVCIDVCIYVCIIYKIFGNSKTSPLYVISNKIIKKKNKL